MITDGEKWHYLAIKKLSALLRGVTSKHDGDFYCLNCIQSYTIKNKLEKHYKIWKNEDNKILKQNHGEKSMKVLFVIYADLKCLLEKMNTPHNNQKKWSATEKNKHIPSGYSLFAQYSFDTKK